MVIYSFSRISDLNSTIKGPGNCISTLQVYPKYILNCPLSSNRGLNEGL